METKSTRRDAKSKGYLRFNKENVPSGVKGDVLVPKSYVKAAAIVQNANARKGRKAPANNKTSPNKKPLLDRGDAKPKPFRHKEIKYTEKTTPFKRPSTTKVARRKPRQNLLKEDYNAERKYNVLYPLPNKPKERYEVKDVPVEVQNIHERSKNILTQALRKLNDSSPSRETNLFERRKIPNKYTFKQDDALKKKLERKSLADKMTRTESSTAMKKSLSISIEPLLSEMPLSSPSSVESMVKPGAAVIPKQLQSTPARKRRPLIKTIKSANKSKTFKAVTFVDHKEKSTILQINLPNDLPKKKRRKDDGTSNSGTPKNRSTRNTSKTSVRGKDRSRLRMGSRVSSPLPLVDAAPPTEVAKWVPACLTQHTKPYYEAWVDTTLATRNKENSYIDEELVKRFQKKVDVERPSTPDLVYEHSTDEHVIGRITIRR